MLTKDKIINHLTHKGKKTISEKILNKSIKELQKTSTKQTKKLVQLSLILSSAIFKIRTIKNKKNRKQKDKIRPSFISNTSKRFSFATKLIIASAKKSYDNNCLYKKLKDEFLYTAQLRSNITKSKKDLEKKALKEKHLLKYYRWN